MALIKDYKISVIEKDGLFKAKAIPKINSIANQNYRFSKKHYGLKRKKKEIESSFFPTELEAIKAVKEQIKKEV
ncbi:MAG: hypothetical protein ED557_08245 [Balneola sp.]|nr:MAG: hypothetical protein ED557_08245 [Balneola sp.]